MYTGTLITDLLATVEQVALKAEHKAERQRIAEARELHEIFSMQISVTHGDQIYLGAA